MTFKWQNVHMPLFLNHFKRYDCLWNNESHDYKDRFARTKAIKAMRSDLNLDGVSERDIKLKIKTIRTKYSSEAAKIRRSTESGSKVYKPKVFWFDQADDFLKGNCVPRPSTTNLHIIKREASPEIDEDNTDDGVCNEKSETSGENRNAEDDIEFKVERNTHTIDIAQSQGSRFPVTRRHKHRHIQAMKRRKRRNEVAIDRTVDEDKEDEFDLFCRSLAVQLKKMPIQRALICQEKLQSVMVQERLSFLGSSNFSASPSSQTYYVDQSREYVYTASPPSQS